MSKDKLRKLHSPRAASAHKICRTPLGHYPLQCHMHSVCHALSHHLESHPHLTKPQKLNQMLGEGEED